MKYDVIVIGAGPGGYVAAIRAAQLGLSVACVEKEKSLGGTCLNVGCIPSKALLESSELFAQAQYEFKDHGIMVKSVQVDLAKMMERKQGIVSQLTGGIASLFKKNKVESILGEASLAKDGEVKVKQGTKSKTLKAEAIILATGSVPIEIPGIKIDQKQVVDSTGALSLQKIPQKMLVIGGGYIGLEMGSVYLRLGSEVLVVEALDRIVPHMDQETGKALERSLKKQGMQFQVSTKVTQVKAKKSGVDVTLEDAKGKKETMTVDVVLVSVGRKPFTEGLGLDKVGIQTDERGRVMVNEEFQTSKEGIYAIGDLIEGPMLAHKASEEGVAVAEILAGEIGHVNYETIPSVVYTHPEVASVGLTEEQAKEKGIEYKKFKFSFMANGRALSLGSKEGFVKMIGCKKTDRLIGAHLIGPRVSDLIGELVLGMEFSASCEDIARTIHAHPTLSESIKEAALGLGDGAIHS